jgi:hypothetical protein
MLSRWLRVNYACLSSQHLPQTNFHHCDLLTDAINLLSDSRHFQSNGNYSVDMMSAICTPNKGQFDPDYV